MNITKYIAILFLSTMLFSCTEKFYPEIDENVSVLVVDGKITNGIGSCEVRLFRTVKFTDKYDLKPEIDATVVLHDSQNRTEVLTEHEPGIYRNSSHLIEGEIGSSYWIEILTLSGEKYESSPDLMPSAFEISPLYEEEVEVTTDDNSKKEGVRFYFNTKNNDNTSSYFRWDSRESYEWNSPFINPEPHTSNPYRTCYPINNSIEINVFDASKLTVKEAKHLPTFTVYNNEVKFLYNYLLSVNVYGISKQNYLFWKNMKTIHQNNGSLYDVIPENINGNIETCSDDCQVLGNFEASSVRNKQRMYNSNDFSMEFADFPEECEKFTVKMEIDTPDENIYKILRVIFPIYTLRRLECYECNIKYPVTKPSFWP